MMAPKTERSLRPSVSRSMGKSSLFSKGLGRSSGSILILALWSLGMLSVLAITLGYGVRQKLTIVSRLNQRDQLYLIAQAGAKKASSKVKGNSEETTYTLQDTLSNNPGMFRDIKLGTGSFTVFYDHINERSGATETRYGLADENSKININKATVTVMKELFKVTLYLEEGPAQELAASIVDWRDADSNLSIPLGSAEDSYYRNLTFPYEAKDGDFEVTEELLLVKGVDKNLFEKMKNYITIYGNGKINVNTAPKAVFLAFGLKKDTVDAIFYFRYGKDGILGTEDDEIFDEPSAMVSLVNSTFNIGNSELAKLTRIADQYLAADSSHFSARCVARLNSMQNRTAEVACTIDNEGKVLYWQES